MFNMDTSKSYATEANLLKALDKVGITEGFLVVRNREGRWTAVCSWAVHGVRPAHLGFMTMN